MSGIDFTVTEGEFVGIMGPSGSGKTTLLNILGGIDKPSSGTIKIMNENIENLQKRRTSLISKKKYWLYLPRIQFIRQSNPKRKYYAPYDP